MNTLQVFLLVVFALSLAGQQSASPSAEDTAEKLWKEFQSVVWDSPYREWQRSRPETTCRQFRGDGTYSYADKEWCYRCQQEHSTGSGEWSFYLFDPAEPLVCRLQQFRAYGTGHPLPALEEIHEGLALRLDAVYGPGEEPVEVHEFGSAFWSKVLGWRTSTLEILLYIDEGHYQGPRLGLLARHKPLLHALQESNRLREIERQRMGALKAALERDLVEEIGSDFPEIVALFKEGKKDQLALRAAVENLIENARTAGPERRPALLLAADELAERIYFGEPSSDDWNQTREIFGLTYWWNALAIGWEYQHDLLQRVRNEYGETLWGEYAVVLLLRMGCRSGACCPEGTDQFRVVIRTGEGFLARQSQDAHRLVVLSDLAEAYETWWSLSRAHENDSYVERSRYQEGADAAREKAIAYYEGVLRLASESDEAALARRRLPRLKLGIDTNQRRFFCIYD